MEPGRGSILADRHRVSRGDVRVQAKKALQHKWFDDLDMEAMDAMENPEVLEDMCGGL